MMKLLLVAVAVVLFTCEVKAKLKEGDCEGMWNVCGISLLYCIIICFCSTQCVFSFLESLRDV